MSTNPPLWGATARTNLGQPNGSTFAGYNVVGQRVQSLEIGKVLASGGTTSGSAVMRISNPSRRLGCGFQIHFEPFTRTEVASPGSSSWTVHVMDPEGDHKLHELESGEAVPRQYEAETFAPGFLITATLGTPTAAGGALIPGLWMCKARWEPLPPFCVDETNELFGKCNLTIVKHAGVLTP